MLVTLQKDSALSKTLPGKVQTYLAARKPIIGAIDGEAKLVIEESECGFCCEPENATALAEIVKAFITFNDKHQLSVNARKYYDANFSKSIFLQKLIDSFEV